MTGIDGQCILVDNGQSWLIMANNGVTCCNQMTQHEEHTQTPTGSNNLKQFKPLRVQFANVMQHQHQQRHPSSSNRLVKLAVYHRVNSAAQYFQSPISFQCLFKKTESTTFFNQFLSYQSLINQLSISYQSFIGYLIKSNLRSPQMDP